MTEILCSWLNNEARVSKRIEVASFANEFSSGYLIGELLHKYGLQEDFDQFTPTTASNSKLNNFSRIEPTIHLLNIPFDTQIARDIMDAKPGAAAKLVYELFISLTRKERSGLTGTAMETMRPKAPAKLHALAGQVYLDEMHRKVPRESTLQLERISQTYNERQKKYEAFAFRERLEEDERRRNAVALAQEKESQERQKRHALQAELFARLHAAKYDVTSFVPTHTHVSEGDPANTKRFRELRTAMKQIDDFERRLEETKPVVAMSDADMVAYIKHNQKLQEAMEGQEDLLPDIDLEAIIQNQKVAAEGVTDYMTRIKRRLAEERAARVEREKRRRKVLLDQLRAREQQEEERREHLLLNRLLRRSQQERRIAAQLLAIRREKDVIRENRLFAQKTFAETREAEFRAALEQNAAMCRLQADEDEAILAESRRTHKVLLEERQQAKYERHYGQCWNLFEAVIDLSCRFAEYRQMTNKKPIPLGLANEWKRLLIAGLPIYDEPSLGDLPVDDVTKVVSEIVPPQMLSTNALQLLDQLDFSDYLGANGIWKDEESQQPEPSLADKPITEQSVNRILKHVTDKLAAEAFPPPPKPKIEALPPFRMLAALVGKPFSGTTTVCYALATDSRLKMFSISDLVDAALKLSEQPVEELIVPQVASELGIRDENETQQTPITSDLPKTSELSQSEASVQQTVTQPTVQLTATDPTATTTTATATTEQVTTAETTLPTVANSEVEQALFKQKRRELAFRIAAQIKTGEPIPTELMAQLVVDELRSIPEEEAKSLIVVIGGFPITFYEARLFHAIASGFQASETEEPQDILSSELPKTNALKFLDLAIVLNCPDDLCLSRNASINGADPFANPNSQGLEQRLVWFAERWPEVEAYLKKTGVSICCIDASTDIENVCAEAFDAIETRIAEMEAPPPAPVEEARPATPLLEQITKEEPPPPPPREPTPPPPPAAPAKKGRGKSPKGDKSAKKTADKKTASPKGSPKLAKKGGKKTPEPEPVPVPVAPPPPPGPTPDQPEWVFIDRPISLDITVVLAKIWQNACQYYSVDCQRALRGVRLERDQLVRFLYRVRVDLATMLQQPDTKRDFVAIFCRDFNQSLSGELRTVDEETRSELHQRCDDLRDRLWAICERKRAAAEKRRFDIATSGWIEERVGIVLNHLIRLMQAEVDRFHAGVCLMRDYYHAMDSPIPENYVHPVLHLPLYQLPSEESLLAELGEANNSPNQMETQPPPSQMSASAQPARPDSRSRSKKSRSPKPSAEPESTSAVPPQSFNAVNLEVIPRRARDLQPTVAVLPEQFAPTDKKRRPSAGKRAAEKKGKGKQDAITMLTESRRVEPSTQLPTDLELRLLFDSWWGAFSTIHNLSTVEQILMEREKEAAEEARAALAAERAAAAAGAPAEKDKDKDKDKKKGAKGKRSPSPTKARSPSPKNVVVDLESGETAAEKEKRLLKDNMRLEYLYAIECDERLVKQRLEMIRVRGQTLVEEMKRSYAIALDTMTEMAGQRFLQEMTAVDQLLAYMRNCIERSVPLNADLVLDGDKFWALFGEDGSRGLIPIIHSPLALDSLPTFPSSAEHSTPEISHPFAISQLYTLHQQFVRFAPSGIMEIRAFEELVRDVGSDLFAASNSSPLGGPTGAKRQQLSPSAVAELGQLVACDGDFADWRLLLLCLAHPWPIPTRSDIVSMLIRFRDMDQRRLSSLSRPQFNRVEMWFPGSPIEQAFGAKDLNTSQRPPSAGDVVWRGGQSVAASAAVTSAGEAIQGDSRLQQFRDFAFDIFSEHGSSDQPSHLQQPRIDYVTMLSYVARVPDGTDSLVRLLSLALADHITSGKQQLTRTSSTKLSQQDAWQSSVLRQAADVSREQLRVPMDPLFRVLSTHIRMKASHSRVGDAAAKEERVLKEKLQSVYAELNGRGGDDSVPLGVLLKHPVTEEILAAAALNFRAPHPKSVFRVFQDIEKE